MRLVSREYGELDHQLVIMAQHKTNQQFRIVIDRPDDFWLRDHRSGEETLLDSY